MDDVAGLKWTSTPANGRKQPTPTYTAFSTLKPTPPASGRATPLNGSSSNPPSKSTTPANDSFANLIPFGPGPNKNLSLLEQQKRQTEVRQRQQQIESQNRKEPYTGGDDQFWNNLGRGGGTPVANSSKDATTNLTNNATNNDEDDLFAVFNKPATSQGGSNAAPVQRNTPSYEDDDPFGLSESKPKSKDTAAIASTFEDDDDVLGLLGTPASARPKAASPPLEPRNPAAELHPQDKAIAELVEMGFPAVKARHALEATESGTDIQAAVGLLLNQAHAEARKQTQARDRSQTAEGDGVRGNGRPGSEASRRQMHYDEEDRARKRQQTPLSAPEEGLEHMTADFGSNFLKTAGSLWKQGTKRVQQAVQELNSDGDSSSQPRWMRETENPRRPDAPLHAGDDASGTSRPRRRSPEVQRPSTVTDEAMMLESSRPTPPPRPAASSRQDRRLDSSAGTSRDHSPALPLRLKESIPPKQPAFLRQQTPSPTLISRSTLNKIAAEDQAAQAYVSSARRRKPPPTAQSAVSGPEPDLLEGSFRGAARPHPPLNAATKPISRPQSQPVRRTEAPVRPPPPTRTIPTVSAISLQACHSHREKGNEHFKRGDYSSAHQSYGTSISHLPDRHPLIIVLLTNRALTALKIGEPKTAISDADKAMAVIGSSKGESESIDFGNGKDAPKAMREYYGKALMRKAEALEQMEKWADAAVVWREAVQGGHGGATSIQGRMRAEKAATPEVAKPKPRPPVAATRAPASAPPGRPTSTLPAAAVTRLRAANLAAEQADDEKFRLADSVDARIQAWKGGKADNLRALLGSLDNVLWEGSGWKKISMADLVLPAKVKVQYMKGIAKVHPDKIPTDATTEQRMIAGAVFSALNEAWDKFKAENGL
nr:auxilin-like clathrin-binding protein required for normal clathrin function [Exophiala xenobiotica]